ncbi:MAG: dipeptidase [Saprospiraceae bacterium]
MIVSNSSWINLTVAMMLCIFMMTSVDIFAQYHDEKVSKKAYKLAQKYGIIDGHVDLPYRLRIKNFRLQKEYLGIPYQTDEGDFDYVRARKGGLVGPFMSIFIPSNYQTDGGAVELADSLINMVEYIAKNQSEYFQLAYSPKDVLQAKKNNKIALPMGMENGAPVEDDLSKIAYFKKRGISYITLTHAKDNKICDSSYDTTRTWKGLSPYGYKAIDEMTNVGIIIDISHVSDSTFYQVLRHVKVPVIASHSSCRKYTPGFERNMSDEMISSMKKNGGIIMVNFGSTFLDSRVTAYNDSLRTVFTNLLTEKGIEPKSSQAEDLEKEFQKSYPKLYSDVAMVADHIDHIVSLAGIDHVGLGSDYDGVGDSLPTGLKDVSDYPNLIGELLKRGYSKSDIKKICIGNLFRVWNVVIKASKR